MNNMIVETEESIHNCLLCGNCMSEGGYEEGYYGYSCLERELDSDKRFPYKNTKCKLYENDDSIASLSNKEVNKELLKTITWEIY